MLADQGLITLADTGEASATVLDVEENARDLEFVAIEADLSPAEDAIAAESPEGNPYANLLVVRAGDETDPRVATLAELLASEEVAQFIEETYSGTVISARS
ncbi:MetQ/NlpA family ABC transporter substrate-binding protein [Ornithinimicrobium sp. CNJ-824]|uniref:MetQ/NlpA family ABC transporter substrate-binding protein n=1 Tax=Ornithinimicrobium sp. CNJ-824 TaxID=1904966 RepID=UPI003158139B